MLRRMLCMLAVLVLSLISLNSCSNNPGSNNSSSSSSTTQLEIINNSGLWLGCVGWIDSGSNEWYFVPDYYSSGGYTTGLFSGDSYTQSVNTGSSPVFFSIGTSSVRHHTTTYVNVTAGSSVTFTIDSLTTYVLSTVKEGLTNITTNSFK